MKFEIVYLNWPLTGKNVVVAKAATLENAQRAAAKWARDSKGATIMVRPI